MTEWERDIKKKRDRLVYEKFDLFKFLKEKTDVAFAIFTIDRYFNGKFADYDIRLIYTKTIDQEDLMYIVGASLYNKSSYMGCIKYSKLIEEDTEILDVLEKDKYGHVVVDFERPGAEIIVKNSTFFKQIE